MYGNKLVQLGLALLALVVLARGDEVKSEETHEHVQNNVIPQSTGQVHPSNDFAIPTNVVSMIANGGVVAAVVLAVGLLAMLIAPSFASLRLCSIMGNCQDTPTYQAYSADPYGNYQGYQQGTYNNPGYQRRSLEYVGPILKALGNAYERYSRATTTKA